MTSEQMNSSPGTVQQVYRAINLVQAELAECGITKDRRNSSQGYNFRGIDDVYNVLSPILAKCGLCILPRMISRSCEEVSTKNGGTMRYVTVEAEFDFVSVEDGSRHTCRTFGEAMDSADKATNKAMSAAYKYAAFQAFAIPTEGDNDADAHTPEIASKSPAPRAPARSVPSARPSGPVVDWRKAVIHVGTKYKGQLLGDVPDNVKEWFLTEWKKDKVLGQYPENDQLITALEDMAYSRANSAIQSEGAF